MSHSLDYVRSHFINNFSQSLAAALVMTLSLAEEESKENEGVVTFGSKAVCDELLQRGVIPQEVYDEVKNLARKLSLHWF